MNKTLNSLVLAALIAIPFGASPASGSEVAKKVQEMIEAADYKTQLDRYSELLTLVGPKDLPLLVRFLQVAKKGQNISLLFPLMEIADSEKMILHLKLAMAHPVLEAKTMSAQYLGKHGDFTWVPVFLKSIADRDIPPLDRQAMVRAFSFVTHAETVGRILGLVQQLHAAVPPDQGADSVCECIIRLFTDGQWQRFAQAFRDALEAGGPRTRSAAAAMLVRLGDPAGLNWIVEAYSSGEKSDVELYMDLHYLMGIRGKKMTALLLIILEKSTYRQLTLKAIGLLGESRDASVIDLLKKRIDDKDAETAEAAALALGNCGGESLISFWIERLANKEPLQRVRAAAPLLAMDQQEGLLVLLEVLKDASVDPNSRTEAALALSSRATRDMVEPLLDQLADPDPKLSRACWFTLAKVFRAIMPYRGPDVFSPELIRRGRLLERTKFDPDSMPAISQEKIKALREYWKAHK